MKTPIVGTTVKTVVGTLVLIKNNKNSNFHHDKEQGGTLYKKLCIVGIPYRKRYGKKDRRGKIPGMVFMESRLAAGGGIAQKNNSYSPPIFTSRR
jgi:hypothetical protein